MAEQRRKESTKSFSNLRPVQNRPKKMPITRMSKTKLPNKGTISSTQKVRQPDEIIRSASPVRHLVDKVSTLANPAKLGGESGENSPMRSPFRRAKELSASPEPLNLSITRNPR